MSSYAEAPEKFDTDVKPASSPRTTDAVKYDPNYQYRSLNRSAVGSVVMLLLGLTALSFWQLAILPVAGMLLAYSAIRTIKRYPDEFSGLGLARFGLVANLLLVTGSIGYHSFIYATEVPEGYERVFFSEVQEDASLPGRIPKRAIELRGKKIFVKGYVHPGVSGMGKVDRFVLVPDMGTCCFGGQPKMTDMMLVQTTPDTKVAYVPRIQKLCGEFQVGTELESVAGVENVLYRLNVDRLAK